jgi:glucosamine-phosphate N-acetyltransferase
VRPKSVYIYTPIFATDKHTFIPHPHQPTQNTKHKTQNTKHMHTHHTHHTHHTLRPLVASDRKKHYLGLLGQLSRVEESDDPRPFNAFVENMSPDHVVLVIEDEKNKRIVATGTVWLEHKLSHGGKPVAHIEDIVVDRQSRKTGLGTRVLQALMQLAEARGCHKVVLCASAEGERLYLSQGFERKEVAMVKRIDSERQEENRAKKNHGVGGGQDSFPQYTTTISGFVASLFPCLAQAFAPPAPTALSRASRPPESTEREIRPELHTQNSTTPSIHARSRATPTGRANGTLAQGGGTT